MTRWESLIAEVQERIIGGGAITRQEATELNAAPPDVWMKLFAASDAIRLHFRGTRFDACSLINAKSGRCGEDCKFCAQSGRYNTGSEVYGLKNTQAILDAARAAKAFGASRFCTVTSGGALSDEEFANLTDSLSLAARDVDIALDASLGFLSEERAQRLREVGVSRYNHNLETSREYYGEICTTHSFDRRVDTVRRSLETGFSACSGGIIGMGETAEQRLDLAFTLAELGVDCVPINVLNARPGTPLEHAAPLPVMEILKTVALFRMILPTATIKIAGGREANLKDFQGLALRSGANGVIIGGYLTTSGRSVDDDVRMIRDAGYVI